MHIRYIFITFLLMLSTTLSALPFNDKLNQNDIQTLNEGQMVIRNIDYAKNMSIISGSHPLADQLISMVKGLSPKYLGEVILIKPYEGNEDLPERIGELLNNIESYTDISYYSEHAGKWYMLYDKATIVNNSTNGNKTILETDLEMKPFGLVQEHIEVVEDSDALFYSAYNTNSLNYKEIKNLLAPQKMKIGIVVFRDGDQWIIYGVGGANAPHILFLTDRIRVSLINRICSFCEYIFKKL